MTQINEETANVEFARWCSLMDLDHKFEDSSMDEDDRRGADRTKRTIVRAIMAGSLSIDEDGVATFTPQSRKTPDQTPIVFDEPTGADIRAMDSRKDREMIAKMHAVLGSWTKQNAKRYAQMAKRDLAVCEALFVAFLA